MAETFRRPDEALRSQAVILKGNVDPPTHICCRVNAAGCKQSRKAGEQINGNLLTCYGKGRRSAGPASYKQGKSGEDREGWGNLGCSEHEIVEFEILRERERGK